MCAPDSAFSTLLSSVLAVVLDAVSRRVVGRGMGHHPCTKLALEAVGIALRHRQPALGLIRHSDHSGQDTSMHSSQSVIPHLTKEQQRQGLQALAELERLGAAIAAGHGKPTPESWELINQSRDERARDLMRAVEE